MAAGAAAIAAAAAANAAAAAARSSDSHNTAAHSPAVHISKGQSIELHYFGIALVTVLILVGLVLWFRRMSEDFGQ
jgi:hypothetical protein